MKTGLILTSLLVVICMGCSKQAAIKKFEEPSSGKLGGKVYLIKKGNHYAEDNAFTILQKQEVSAEVIFDSSAIYQSVHPENQYDVNKLIGFSDCNDHHQENSARIGWSWNGKMVVLYAYAYVNRQRVIKTLGAVALNAPVYCSVKASGDKYYFTAGEYVDSLNRHCAGYTGISYKLYPYFGGDEPAPHDIQIRIKE